MKHSFIWPYWFLLVSVFYVSSLAKAEKNDAGNGLLLQQLLSGNDSLQSQALKSLIAVKDPATFPLLSAINDKKCYVYAGVPVTTNEKNTDEKGVESFRIYRLYPKYEPYNQANGEMLTLELSSLKEIEISRSNRLLIAPLIPYLNLVSIIPEKRKLAYSQFQSSEDGALLPLLQKSIVTEKDDDVLRLGKETIFTIMLKTTTSDAVVKMAIDSLEYNWGPNTESILHDYGTVPPTNEVKNYAMVASGKLKKKHELVSVAQNLFSGLSLGSILILIALGLSIIYGIAGVINMAHGEFLMIGAYTTFAIQEIFPKTSDAFFLVSLPVSFLVAGIVGFIIERLIIRFLYSRPLESLLATWGVSLVLVQIARSIFGDLTAVRAPRWLSGGWEIFPHLILPYNRLFIIGISIFIITITYLTLYRSRLGMLIRAVTQNRNMSSCLGIETRRVDAITFFLGSGLAGIAGCAMTLIGNVVPDMGQTYIVDSFLVVVTGGVGKMAGAIISGFGIGFLTKFLESMFEAVYGKVFILVIIIMFLQFKPKGMFPDKGRIGDD
jgi:urea transport system permease protein